jgi:hypothetical protein
VRFGRFAQEDPMRMLTLRTAAWITAALVLTASVIAASAQIQTRGAAGLHAQMQNATPLVRQAACWGWARAASAAGANQIRCMSRQLAGSAAIALIRIRNAFEPG